MMWVYYVAFNRDYRTMPHYPHHNDPLLRMFVRIIHFCYDLHIDDANLTSCLNCFILSLP